MEMLDLYMFFVLGPTSVGLLHLFRYFGSATGSRKQPFANFLISARPAAAGGEQFWECGNFTKELTSVPRGSMRE